MKQILQNIKNGETILAEVPSPHNMPGHILIQTRKTLVSAGTERMLVDFGKANWINKARQQPDKVKMVLDKVKTDGFKATFDSVKSKLDQPLALGYCNVGKVLESDISSIEKNTRVVSNGNHAEVVRVPKNLCAVVPQNVSDEEACFTVVGAIALQGVRLSKPTLGECYVVVGLGLIGQITVQLLRANGCRVLGVDFDEKKCELAKSFGAEVVNPSKGEDLLASAKIFSRGRGVDSVIITASSKSNDIISNAANMCRKRGRIILVGVIGLELSRADFYEKEISFQVSCSYGPGRYDPEFEEKGHDYPIGYVRWTEQRNFEAFLDLVSSGMINLKALISHEYNIDDALKAYDTLGDTSSLGILINYPEKESSELRTSTITLKEEKRASAKAACSFIGAGNYASRVLIPAFDKAGAQLHTLVSSGGLSSFHHGKKNDFLKASTSFSDVIEDESFDTAVIATQHHLHASQVVDCLKKGKNIFVEKPLALKKEEVELIHNTYSELHEKPLLMVGYNRRFSPLTKKMKQLIDATPGAKTYILTMNAGEIPKDHWTQDPELGGGRIIGEACHYIDLLRYLVGSKISSFQAMCLGPNSGEDVLEDKSIISLSFEDGSIGSIHYYANGGKEFPKERVEVFGNSGVLQLDNFRKLSSFGWKGFSKEKLSAQNKGNSECVEAFVSAVKAGTDSPIPYDEIIEVAEVSCAIAESLRNK